MNSMKKEKLSLKKYLFFSILFVCVVLNLNDIFYEGKAKKIDIQIPGSQWQIHNIESGECVLFNPITEEMIYKAFRQGENGVYTEIPLNEYLIFKNTTTTISNIYEKAEKKYISFSEKDFTYKKNDIGIYWTYPQKTSADMVGPVFLPMGDEIYELPEEYIFYDMETKLIKLISEETYFKIPFTNNVEIKVKSDIKYSEIYDQNSCNTVIREIRMKKENF